MEELQVRFIELVFRLSLKVQEEFLVSAMSSAHAHTHTHIFHGSISVSQRQ